MTINNQQLSGRTSNYRFDRGGKPAEMGPFIGTVMNNVDPIRTGRLQVRIQQFATGPDNNPQSWRWVNYLPPFYGVTEKNGTDTGAGTYPGNQQLWHVVHSTRYRYRSVVFLCGRRSQSGVLCWVCDQQCSESHDTVHWRCY